MIKETYVSFETAKLLKEKGFDDKVSTHYLVHPSGFPEFFDKKDEFVNPEDVWLKCPTHQMVMKWLREVHNIFIDISSRFSKNADKDVCFSYSCKKLIDTYKSSYEIGDGEWLNYEEACEAAIKYCLENLI